MVTINIVTIFLWWYGLMKKKVLFLAFSQLIAYSAFASCNINISSYVDDESSIVKTTVYDNDYESFVTVSAPLSAINATTFAFNVYGNSVNCSTGKYKGDEVFSIKLSSCNKAFNSSDLSNFKDGQYYTQKCNSNLSLDGIMKYDAEKLDVSIVPTGNHAILFNSYVVDKKESATIAFKLDNLHAISNFNSGMLSASLKSDGYYSFANGYGGGQYMLYNWQKNKNSSIEIFESRNGKYTKLGSCSVSTGDLNKINVKCLTLANSNNYKIISKYNEISVIDAKSFSL